MNRLLCSLVRMGVSLLLLLCHFCLDPIEAFVNWNGYSCATTATRTNHDRLTPYQRRLANQPNVQEEQQDTLSTSYKIVAGLDLEWFDRFVVTPLGHTEVIDGESVAQIRQQGLEWKKERKVAENTVIKDLSSIGSRYDKEDESPKRGASLDHEYSDAAEDLDANTKFAPLTTAETVDDGTRKDSAKSFMNDPVAEEIPKAKKETSPSVDSESEDKHGKSAESDVEASLPSLLADSAREKDPVVSTNLEEATMGVVSDHTKSRRLPVLDKTNVTFSTNSADVVLTAALEDPVAAKYSDDSHGQMPATMLEKHSKSKDLSTKESKNAQNKLPEPLPVLTEDVSEKSRPHPVAEKKTKDEDTASSPGESKPIGDDKDIGKVSDMTASMPGTVSTESKYSKTSSEKDKVSMASSSANKMRETQAGPVESVTVAPISMASLSALENTKTPVPGQEPTKADDRIVMYRASFSKPWKSLPLEKYLSLGYAEKDILMLTPSTLEVLAREGTKCPSVGIPARWKQQGNSQVLVKIVSVDEAKSLEEPENDTKVTASDNTKSSVNPVKTRQASTASQVRDPSKSTKRDTRPGVAGEEEMEPRSQPERRQKRREASQPLDQSRASRKDERVKQKDMLRARQRIATLEDGTPKPVYSGRLPSDRAVGARRRGDPPSPNSNIWPDIETFRKLLRTEAEFRLRILGDGWSESVKEETMWRHDLYSDWLWTLHNGIGKPIVESRSDRFRRLRDQARLEESRDLRKHLKRRK